MKVRPILLVNLLIVVLMAGFALWAAGKAPAGISISEKNDEKFVENPIKSANV